MFAESPGAPLRLHSVPGSMPPKPTLVLADDDADHAALLSAWLERQGYAVARFASGDALLAWAAGAAGSVDAFVLDVDMPGRSGFEVCRALKDIPVFADTPTVFVSSLARSADPGEGCGPMILKGGEMLPRLAAWLEENLGTPV